MTINTGSEFFVYITQQQPFLTNYQNDNVRNIIKVPLRFVVASIALCFFARIGFYYNISLFIGKGILGSISMDKNEALNKRSTSFLNQAKLHFIASFIDLMVLVFKNLFVIGYSIFPTKMQDNLKKLISRAQYC